MQPTGTLTGAPVQDAAATSRSSGTSATAASGEPASEASAALLQASGGVSPGKTQPAKVAPPSLAADGAQAPLVSADPPTGKTQTSSASDSAFSSSTEPTSASVPDSPAQTSSAPDSAFSSSTEFQSGSKTASETVSATEGEPISETKEMAQPGAYVPQPIPEGAADSAQIDPALTPPTASVSSAVAAQVS